MAKSRRRSAFEKGRVKKELRRVSISEAARMMDALARRVYHVDLNQCRDRAKFKIGVMFIIRNLEKLLKSFRGVRPDDQPVGRRLEGLQVRAKRMLTSYRSALASLDQLEDWQAVAADITANYEILRFEAGHLHQSVTPDSPFGVLRSAL